MSVLQDVVMNTVESFSNMLNTTEEVTPEQRERNMDYMLALIGNVLDVSTCTLLPSNK
jgi:hypothetical protein